MIRGAGTAPVADAEARGLLGAGACASAWVAPSATAMPAAASIARNANFDLVMSSESRSCAEIDDLRSVVAFLDVGYRKRNLDRPKGRFPVHAKTSRGTECHIVLDAHKPRREGGAVVGRNPRGQVAHRAEIGKQGQGNAIVRGQELRQTQICGADRK